MKYHALYNSTLLAISIALPLASHAYSNADCGSKQDMSSHFLCCINPNAESQSVWAPAPNDNWYCVAGQENNCIEKTPVFDDKTWKKTHENMTEWCKQHHKEPPIFS